MSKKIISLGITLIIIISLFIPAVYAASEDVTLEKAEDNLHNTIRHRRLTNKKVVRC